MTDFTKLPVEAIEEWRASETTQAFVALILHKKASEANSLVDAVKGTFPINQPLMHHIGGKLAAYDELFFDIMRK